MWRAPPTCSVPYQLVSVPHATLIPDGAGRAKDVQDLPRTLMLWALVVVTVTALPGVSAFTMVNSIPLGVRPSGIAMLQSEGEPERTADRTGKEKVFGLGERGATVKLKHWSGARRLSWCRLP